MSTPDQQRSGGQTDSLDAFVAAGAALPDSPGLQAFVSDVCANSGLDPASLRPEEARYSLILPKLVLEDLDLASSFDYEGQTTTLAELLGPQLQHSRASLARAVWALESFDELRDFLRSLRVLLRYSREAEHPLSARVLPVAGTLQMIGRVERNEHLGSGGELVVDSVTRMLGLRRKLLLLDYNRRLNGAANRGDTLLGRTRSRRIS